MTLHTGAEIREATAKEEKMKRAHRIEPYFGLMFFFIAALSVLGSCGGQDAAQSTDTGEVTQELGRCGPWLYNTTCFTMCMGSDPSHLCGNSPAVYCNQSEQRVYASGLVEGRFIKSGSFCGPLPACKTTCSGF